MDAAGHQWSRRGGDKTCKVDSADDWPGTDTTSTVQVMAEGAPGRSCPTSYLSRPEDLAEPASRATDVLYVVGGLYGSVAALDAVLARAALEDSSVLLVFNGDFHYLDVAVDDFQAVAEGVAQHLATRGNVETELVSVGSDVGCGCGYPDYVGDGTVRSSNAVMRRLLATGQRVPQLVAPLRRLPKHLVIDVGGVRVGVLHGDPGHLAGWRLALEAMKPGDHDVRAWTHFRGATTRQAEVTGWLRRGRVHVLASTHTGLPYLQTFAVDGAHAAVANNGTAALPCFAGTRYGLLTRLSTDPAPPPDALYGTQLDGARCDAVPVRYDVAHREAEFLASWPPGTAGHRAYARRLAEATPLRPWQAARGAQVLHERGTQG